MLETVRVLLDRAVDYAGLFPPSNLSIAKAIENFRGYAAGPENWMLGRFVVPVERLNELETAALQTPLPAGCLASVLTGEDVPAAIPAILAFNAHVRDIQIDSIEARVPEDPRAIGALAGAVPNGFVLYWEVPFDSDLAPALEAIAQSKGLAKIRTGGIRPDKFPSVEQAARFICECDRARVPFKATAGLHHAVRGSQRLTYDADSESCVMHGFLNLLLACAFQWNGLTEQETAELLGESIEAFRFSRKGVAWKHHWIGAEQIRSARERLILSFGSCSFDEPVSELRRSGLL